MKELIKTIKLHFWILWFSFKLRNAYIYLALTHFMLLVSSYPLKISGHLLFSGAFKEYWKKNNGKKWINEILHYEIIEI